MLSTAKSATIPTGTEATPARSAAPAPAVRPAAPALSRESAALAVMFGYYDHA